MSEYTTIWEEFELPSKGLIYDKSVNPHISLRSMTVAEEMKRLSPTETPYKVMSDIIEDCMKDKPTIHVTEMSLGDYQFLLHKLRIVTYGKDYKMLVTCPKCGETTEMVADLDTLEVSEWDENITKDQLISLPVSNYSVELRFQSPRDLDVINYRTKELRKKLKTSVDFSILFTLMSLIRSVDGKLLSEVLIEDFVKKLPTKDCNYILTKAAELNKKVGINNTISMKCVQCGFDIDAPFRITSEFFGPTN